MLARFGKIATITTAITPALFLLTPVLLQEFYFKGWGKLPYITLLPTILVAFYLAIRARFNVNHKYHYLLFVFGALSLLSITSNPLPNPLAVITIVAYGYASTIILNKYSLHKLYKRYFIFSILGLNLLLITLWQIKITPHFIDISRYMSVFFPNMGLSLDVFTLASVNFLAIVFSADIILDKINRLEIFVYSTTIILLTLLIYLSGSRTFIIAVLFLFIAFTISHKKSRVKFGIIFASMVSLIIVYNSFAYFSLAEINSQDDGTTIDKMLLRKTVEIEMSNNFRIQSSLKMFQIWMKSPKNIVLGVGLWNVPTAIARSAPELIHIKISEKGGRSDPYVYPHNLPLWILTGTGLIGITIMSLYYFLFGRDVLKNTTKHNRALNLTIAFFLVLICNLFFPIANIAYALTTAALLSSTSILQVKT